MDPWDKPVVFHSDDCIRAEAEGMPWEDERLAIDAACPLCQQTERERQEEDNRLYAMMRADGEDPDAPLTPEQHAALMEIFGVGPEDEE